VKSISTNFRFKPDFHQRIKDAANASGISLTAWVVAACFDRLKREDRKRRSLAKLCPAPDAR
jgi:predicted HicB family RNase H-like nuclease